MNDDPNASDSILAEFLRFLREEKKWFLAPILVVLGLVSVLLITLQGSALAPFLYPIF